MIIVYFKITAYALSYKWHMLNLFIQSLLGRTMFLLNWFNMHLKQNVVCEKRKCTGAVHVSVLFHRRQDFNICNITIIYIS